MSDGGGGGEWKQQTEPIDRNDVLREEFDRATELSSHEWPHTDVDVEQEFAELQLVGQGTYGAVFLARHLPDSTELLALKMFIEPTPPRTDATLHEHDVYEERWSVFDADSRNEVRNALYMRAVSARDHAYACPPHIVCYVAHFEAPFARAATRGVIASARALAPDVIHRFLLTHYVEGIQIEQLWHHPAEQTGLTLTSYYRLLATAAFALNRMHEARAYHRDLSSANIQVHSWDNEERAESVIIDLGASCVSFDSAGVTRCDLNGPARVNTVYRPPEVDSVRLRYPGNIDAAMSARDVFSLGVIFLRLHAVLGTPGSRLLRVLGRATSTDWRRRPSAYAIAHFAGMVLHPNSDPPVQQTTS
jgi:serine/threonine protein kinase